MRASGSAPPRNSVAEASTAAEEEVAVTIAKRLRPMSP